MLYRVRVCDNYGTEPQGQPSFHARGCGNAYDVLANRWYFCSDYSDSYHYAVPEACVLSTTWFANTPDKASLGVAGSFYVSSSFSLDSSFALVRSWYGLYPLFHHKPYI
jgi:hypothetical protein